MEGLSKVELRNKYTLVRDALTPANRARQSVLISRKLLALEESESWETIHVYIPMRSEVDIRSFTKHLIECDKKTYTSRTMQNGRLTHWRLLSFDQCMPGRFGTVHPAGEKAYTGSFEVIIVPGIVFDAKGNRIGYGGGYYDRFLADHPDSLKIGVCFREQLIKEIQPAPHDVRMDRLITA